MPLADLQIILLKDYLCYYLAESLCLECDWQHSSVKVIQISVYNPVLILAILRSSCPYGEVYTYCLCKGSMHNHREYPELEGTETLNVSK